jgi:hypothetical protein
MTVFPIPDELAAAYKGSGHALAAVKDGRLIDLLYLRDLLPGFEPEGAETALKDIRLASSIAHLSSLGEVSVGMCSCWEFSEL